MYKIHIQNKDYEVTQEEGKLLLNGAIFDWDLSQISEGRYHAIYQNQSFNLEVEEADYITKSFKIKVNGQSISISAKDDMDLLLDKLGMSNALSAVVKDIKAPMPGMILEITTKVGDEVQKGDRLLILEAMKMENVVKSLGEGTITAIKVKKGQNVEKNQVLILF